MPKVGRKVNGYLFKRGNVWWARWEAFGTENRKSTGVRVGTGAEEREERRKDAQKVLDGFVGAYKAEAEADVRASLAERQRAAEEKAEEAFREAREAAARVPLAEAWERHPYDTSQLTRGRTKVHPLSAGNVEENKGAWEKFVKWVEDTHGAGHAMQDVTEEWAREWSKAIQAEGLTPQRHNKLLTTAGVMYRLAGLPSPFAGVEKLRELPAEHREPFTKGQVAKLLAAAKGEWKGVVALMYYTGLRRGDAVLLKAEQRDRRTGKIRKLTAKAQKLVEPMEHPELTAILDAMAPESGYLFPKLAAAYLRNPRVISQQFRALMGRALGVKGEDGKVVKFDGTDERQGGGKKRVSRYGLHSFRHSFASHAARAGVPIGMLQAWLGHSSPEITRIYAHYGNAKELAKIMQGVSLKGAEKEEGEAGGGE